MFNYEDIPAQVKILNDENAESEGLNVLHCGLMGLYTTTWENLSAHFRAVSSIVKSRITVVSFYLPKFTVAHSCLQKMKFAFVNHHTDYSLEVVKYSNGQTSCAHTLNFVVLQPFLKCLCLHSFEPRDWKRAWKALYDSCQRQILWSGREAFS